MTKGFAEAQREQEAWLATVETRPCVHCEEEVATQNGIFWSHIHRQRDGKAYVGKNRCQSPKVEYGHEAHPEGVKCPRWCLGSKAA